MMHNFVNLCISRKAFSKLKTLLNKENLLCSVVDWYLTSLFKLNGKTLTCPNLALVKS